MLFANVNEVLHLVAGSAQDTVAVARGISESSPRGMAVFDETLQYLWSNHAANTSIAEFAENRDIGPDKLFTGCGAFPRWQRFTVPTSATAAPQIMEVVLERGHERLRLMVVPSLAANDTVLALVFVWLNEDETSNIAFSLHPWRTTLNGSTMPLTLISSSGHLLCTNAAFVELLGEPPLQVGHHSPYMALASGGNSQALAEAHQAFQQNLRVGGSAVVNLAEPSGGIRRATVRWMTIALGTFPLAKLDAVEPVEERIPSQAIRRAEASMQHALEVVRGCPDALLLTEETRIVFASQACERVLGVTADQLAGRDLESLLVDETGRGREVLHKLTVRPLEKPRRARLRLKHANGRAVSVGIHAAPAIEGRHRVLAIRTRPTHSRSEEDLAAISTIIAVANVATRASARLRDTLALVCEALGASAAELLRLDPDTGRCVETYRATPDRTRKSEASERPSVPEPLLDQWRQLTNVTGGPVTIDAQHLSRTSPWADELADDTTTGSLLVSQVRVRDEAQWLLYLHGEAYWSRIDRQRLDRFVQIITLVVEEVVWERRVDELASEREVLMEAMTATQEAICAVSRDGRVLAASPAFLEAFDATMETCDGQPFSTLLDGGTWATVNAAITSLSASFPATVCSLTGTSSGGTSLDLNLTVEARHRPDGELHGYLLRLIGKNPS